MNPYESPGTDDDEEVLPWRATVVRDAYSRGWWRGLVFGVVGMVFWHIVWMLLFLNGVVI